MIQVTKWNFYKMENCIIWKVYVFSKWTRIQINVSWSLKSMVFSSLLCSIHVMRRAVGEPTGISILNQWAQEEEHPMKGSGKKQLGRWGKTKRK